jgi:tripartite ATP-independent transporter DctP family solute receptor
MFKKLAKIISVMVILVLVIGTASGCGRPSSKNNTTPDANNNTNTNTTEKIVMKFSHDQPTSSPFHKSAEKFKEIVEKNSNGKIEVQIYPSQQLGSAREMIEGMQMGTVEMAWLPTAKFGGFDQRLTLVDVPYVFSSEDAMWKALDGEFGQELMSGLPAIGLKGLAFTAEGYKMFSANKPIKSPEDFKGMKIRTMEAPIIMAQYKAWGANPVPIDFAEVYNSLQQKVVDGQENPVISIHDMKFYEVQKWLTQADHAYLSYFLSCSNKWFESLSPELQKVIVDASVETREFHKGLINEVNAKYLQNIKDFGTQVYVSSPEEREAFKKLCGPVYDEFKKLVPNGGAELLEKAAKY